jgi:hypothetical protein
MRTELKYPAFSAPVLENSYMLNLVEIFEITV